MKQFPPTPPKKKKKQFQIGDKNQSQQLYACSNILLTSYKYKTTHIYTCSHYI